MFAKFLELKLYLGVVFEFFRWSQFHHRIDNPFFGALVLEIELHPLFNILEELPEFFWVFSVIRWADLADHPANSLHNEICGDYPVNQLDHFDDDLFSKVLVIGIVFKNKPEEVVQNIFWEILASQLE